MNDFDDVIGENTVTHSLNWQYIPDYQYRKPIIGGSGSGKTNALVNLIYYQERGEIINKIYLYAKDLYEPKHWYLVKQCEGIFR